MEHQIISETLLQEAVSCAEAVLDVITEGALLAVVPAKKEDADRHNRALWLLNMLQDKIADTQARVDAADAAQVRK